MSNRNYNNKNRNRGFNSFGHKYGKIMEENKDYKDEKTAEAEDLSENISTDGGFAGESEDTQAEEEVNTLENQLAKAQSELENQRRDYLFLAADFDNYRKRTRREITEIIRNGGENVLKGLLPIIDDFERGLKAAENATDASSVVEGMTLIYNKLVKFMESMGVKEMQSTGEEFNPDLHEAVAQVPAPTDDMKGKVLDTIQKGYTINDKVLRHAKVAVAQ